MRAQETPAAGVAPAGGLQLSRRFATVSCVGAVALAIILSMADGSRRMRGVIQASDSLLAGGVVAQVDPDSPSGYRWNQHRLVLTQADGYQWMLQAEEAMKDGLVRVRRVDYDDAPSGRDVHWSGFLRWWAQGLGALDRLVHPGLTAPQALERVAPWASTLLFWVFLVGFTPVVAARLGAVPGALLALGCIGVYPFFDLFRVGNFDHHGAVGLACLTAVLLLAMGGAGWVRTREASEATQPAARVVSDWLPTSRVARRWFIAAGLAGAVALWISAATAAPVLIGLAVAGLLNAAASDGAAAARADGTLDPTLFRWWGAAGAVGSFFFYVLEYFPSHLGMRLEVNHPLYGIAFLAGGDLLARVLEAYGQPRSPGESGVSGPKRSPGPTARWSAASVRWLLLDVALLLPIPTLILFAGESTFSLRDPFLWTLHNLYIAEFAGLGRWTRDLGPSQVLTRISLLPLLALPMAAALWTAPPREWRRWAWRIPLIGAVGAGALYAYVFSAGVGGGSILVGVAGVGAAGTLGFGVILRKHPLALASPLRSALMMAFVPALALLVISFAQVRWLQIAAGLWVGALVVSVAALIMSDHRLFRSKRGLITLGCLALPSLVLPPALMMREPLGPDVVAVVARDASYWLRRRLGSDTGVILAAPTTTTYMDWFGGFRGIGTLYWENADGLRSSAEAFEAPDAATARAALAKHGVTHVVFDAFDAGLEHLRASSSAASGGADQPPGFLERIEADIRAGRPLTLPPWLAPLPYVPPAVTGRDFPIVCILEVVDDMSPEVALARLARFYQATGSDLMEPTLRRSLDVGPSVPGLAMAAQYANANGNRVAFGDFIGRLRVELARGEPAELGDRIDVALTMGLAGDAQALSRELSAALAQADERQLRRLPDDRLSLLVDLSRQLGLDQRYPDAVSMAVGLAQAAE